MPVEDDPAIAATEHERDIEYIFDSSLTGESAEVHRFRCPGENNPYFYQFEGDTSSGFNVRSNIPLPSQHASVGRQATGQQRPNPVQTRPTFVYVDCGAWVDSAHGGGEQRRSFAMTCGPHVYLCEYAGGRRRPSSTVPVVDRLFSELAQLERGVIVERYIRAEPSGGHRASEDSFCVNLFLGDLHLPPYTWFYSDAEMRRLAGSTTAGMVRRLDQTVEWWPGESRVYRGARNQYNSHYARVRYDLEHGERREAQTPAYTYLIEPYRFLAEHTAVDAVFGGNPDITQSATYDLVLFLNALSHLSAETKRRLHFAQVGDMLELWVGRPYQLHPVNGRPRWNPGAGERPEDCVDRVVQWTLEIMIQNSPVFDAFHRLRRCSPSLASVNWIWGNHDNYTSQYDFRHQVALPARGAWYRHPNGGFPVFVEHGHRFDPYNVDDTEYHPLLGNPAEVGLSDGPSITNLAYWCPGVRTVEGLARNIIGTPPIRDTCLRGAALTYMYQWHATQSPYSIYVQAHTHASALCRVPINVRRQAPG